MIECSCISCVITSALLAQKKLSLDHQAAEVLGAPPREIFHGVTCPLCVPPDPVPSYDPVLDETFDDCSDDEWYDY